MSTIGNLVLALCALAATLALRHFLRRRSQIVSTIPGPASPSFLYGHMCQLLLPSTYGKHEFKWQKQYGPLYRLKGCFNADRLMVSDPAALRFILHEANLFERSVQQQEIVNMLIGKKTVFYVKGDDHRRVRNIMNAAFAPSSIRALPPLFADIAEKVIEKFEVMMSDKDSSESVMDIYHTIHSATLDGVGEGAIGYKFGALDESNNELAQSHQNIITYAGVRTKEDIIFEAIVPWVPQFVLQAAFSLPTHAFKALQHNRSVSSRVSAELVSSQVEAVSMGNLTGKDLLNVMVRGNASAKDSQKMTNEEMQEQIPSLMIAGQDTTGNTLSMALYELGKDPILQDEIRQEVVAYYERTTAKGSTSYSGLETLPLLNAFLKEVLRFHPGLPMSDRIATQDCILPLSQPIVTTSGKVITELPIPKGQHIIVSTASYNRLDSVWGPDAHVFRPSRWLNGDPPKSIAFGPYSGLATFFGGPRTCIGWRFAVTELQVLLSSLLRRFTFTASEANKVHPVVAVTLAPVSNGKMSLPLIVKPVSG